MRNVGSMFRRAYACAAAVAALAALASAQPLTAGITVSHTSDCCQTRYVISSEGTHVGSYRLDSIENAKITSVTPYPIAGASVVTIDVRPINPTVHARAVLVMRDTAGVVVTAPFVYWAEHIALERDTVDFGYVEYGGSSERSLVLTNPDTIPVTITSVDVGVPGGAFSVVEPTALPVTIPGLGATSVVVRATPPSIYEIYHDTLLISTKCHERFRVALEVSTLDPASADDNDRSAGGTTLRGAEPNPVRGALRISFTLAHSTGATLTLYDALGRLVATLIDDHRASGEHTISYDASRLPSGVYHYRLSADGVQLSRSFVRE